MELAFAGIVASAYGIQVVMRLRAEETGLRAEPVLATAVGRLRWAMSHIVIALAGTTLLMVLVGAGAGLVRGAQTGERRRSAAASSPPRWCSCPRPGSWRPSSWPRSGSRPGSSPSAGSRWPGSSLLGELGPLMNLDHWVMDLSPFAHVPRLPGGPFSATPIVALTAVAALLAAAGLAGLRRRDVGGP